MNRTKVLLSLFVVFQLFAVVLAPNKETYLGAHVAPVIEPYLNFLELASTWNFFAPDPGPPPVYVDWELLDEKGQIIGKGIMPERVDPFVLRERQNRRIALTRFLIYSDQRVEQIFAPYLCRIHPEASSVRIWRATYNTPRLSEVADGTRQIGDEADVERRSVAHHFCKGTP